MSNDIILGAVGVLQFDVVQYRLRDEYKVESVFEPVQVHTARWIEVDDPKKLKEFRDKNDARLAHDHYGQLASLASRSVNLSMTRERFHDVSFLETRDPGAQYSPLETRLVSSLYETHLQH